MALAADFDFQITDGRSGFKCVTADASDNRPLVRGMNAFFHEISPIRGQMNALIYEDFIISARALASIGSHSAILPIR